MASDPAVIEVPAKAWLKIATAVNKGTVHILKKDVMYLQTYRLTGGAAPAPLNDPTGGADLFAPGAPIDSTALIDVYIYVVGSVAGRVRVDV